jgi:ABC-type transport system substrate-binding protein
MAARNYWTNLTNRKWTRRRILLSGASLSLGSIALALLACGDNESGEQTKSSLIYEPTDTSSKATKGGVLSIHQGDDVQTFDTLTNFGQDATAANALYSRLVKWEVFKHPQQVQPNVVGDAAASWEVSPDGLQVTYKVRPGLKLDPRAPTNGRAIEPD